MNLCGAWESDKSAEEMAEEIRFARKFRQKFKLYKLSTNYGKAY